MTLSGSAAIMTAPNDIHAAALTLFPFAVERRSGFDIAMLLSEEPGADVDVSTAPARDRAEVCAALEREIHEAFDRDEPRTARKMLTLKRALFNGRATAENPAIASLPDDLAAHVRALIAIDLTGDAALRSASARCDAMDARLDAFAAREDVRAAILFSGGERARLLRTTRVDGRPVKPGERRRSRLALLQFAARATCKTTPFSFFGTTTLRPIVHVGTGEAPFVPSASRLTMDAALVRRLLWTTILRHAPLRASLLLRLNPSLRQDGATVSWSGAPVDVQPGESWGGKPKPLRLPATPALEAVLALFDGRAPLTFAQLATTIGENSATTLLVSRFVDPVELPGAQEPALSWLSARLAAVAPGQAALHEPLRVLARFERLELGGNAAATIEALAAVRDAVEAFFEALGQPEIAETRPPLYHAVELAEQPKSLPVGSPVIGDFSDALESLIDLVSLGSRSFTLQSRLADAFLDTYGPDGRIDAATFFTRHGTPSHIGSEGTAAIAALLRDAADGDRAISLSPARIADAAAALPVPLRCRTVAIGVQAQWAGEPSEPSLIVNRIFPGGLRLTARHLGQDPAHIDAARAYLQQCHGDALLAALPATQGVTGALHPRLLDLELSVPGIERDRRDTAEIALDTLDARYDTRTHRVILVDDAGRTVAPVLLGAVNPWLLPPVVRLLAENASTSAFPIYATAWSAIDVAGACPARQALAMIPEIRLGHLVLARETMIYPLEDFPDEAEDSLFYRAMIAWLRARGLPTRLFVRFPSGPLLARLSRRVGVREGRDPVERPHVKAKPAFYDFAEPAFAQLFRQQLRGQPPLVSVQACAPALHAGHAREIQFEVMRGEPS